MIIPYGEFYFTPDQRIKFRDGELWKTWAEQYPFLFDEQDCSYAKNQAPFGYFFIEWLGAILIYQATGHRSLQGSYGFPNHIGKRKVVQKLLSKDACEIIFDQAKYHSQPPDLLVYAPNFSNYFFCELKGPGDRLRINQTSYYQEIEKVSGKRVYLLRLKELNLPANK
jgi:hypothetical protein